MIEFAADCMRFPFLRHALLCGLLASIACGIVGSYVTVRRITAIAGAIAHSILGGMGAALYLNREHGISFLTPLHGATAAALIAAVIIGLLSVYGKQREDTVLAAIWSIGMALGILFLSRTRGYTQDLMSYLFGNILMVRTTDLLLIAGLDIVVVGTCCLLYHKFLALSFDEEFTRLRGIHTGLLYILLLCLTSLTIVILVQIVGIVMVIALLTLPAATAAHFAQRLSSMMLCSILLSVFYTAGGLALSYQPDLPAGATIILLAGGGYIAVLLVKGVMRQRRARKQPRTH